MKRFLWSVICVVVLAGCSEDYSAREPFPVEQDYGFDPSLVEALQIDQIQKLYSSRNKLVFYFVTTYEQAAFLKRNAAYLALRTVPDGYELSNMKLTLLDRFEMGGGVYYGMKIQLNGTGLEWLDVPELFTSVELFIAQQPLFQMEVGTVAFREDGVAHVDQFSMEQLKPIVQMLHERQK